MNRDRKMAEIEESMRLNTLEPIMTAHFQG
jgi:hypothetical protein